MKIASYEVHPAAGLFPLLDEGHRLEGVCSDPPVLVQVAPCSIASGFAWVAIVRGGVQEWQPRPVRIGMLGQLFIGLGFRNLDWKSYEAAATAVCPFGQTHEPAIGEVYFARQIGSTGPIKIGWSNCAAGRLEALQVGSPVPLEIIAVLPGDRGAERELHQRFATHRLHGEWFKGEPELLAFIEFHGASK